MRVSLTAHEGHMETVLEPLLAEAAHDGRWLGLRGVRRWRCGLSAGASSPVHDNVERCAELDVELANVYSSGRMLDSCSRIFFFLQRWKALEPTLAGDVTKGDDK